MVGGCGHGRDEPSCTLRKNVTVLAAAASADGSFQPAAIYPAVDPAQRFAAEYVQSD